MKNFDVLKKNWIRQLVGEPELIRNNQCQLRTKLQLCNEKAKKAWDLLKTHHHEDTPALFLDRRLESTPEMTREYSYIRDMAIGFATYGCEYYQNSDLLKDILWALDWMYRHYYGEAELENKGWIDVYGFNWHDWQIGTPRNMMDALILVDEHVPVEKKRAYLKLFDMLVPKPYDSSYNKVAFGRVVSQCGILTERPERILCGRDEIDDTFLYTDGIINNGQGFYRDGSHIFHTRHPMVGSYGLEHFSEATIFASLLAGSEYTMKQEHINRLYEWLHQTFLPFFTHGNIMISVTGRFPERVTVNGFMLLTALLRLYQLSTNEKKKELSGIIHAIVEKHPLFMNKECPTYFTRLSISEYLLFRQVMNEKVESATLARGVKAFNQMDQMTQQEKDYAFGLSMSSSRIYNYECINHLNMKGWYRGDGMLNCYADPLQYDEHYWNHLNAYRVPGTTVDDRERELATIAQCNEYLSGQDFVGGLSIGDTGFAAMQLESYHSDGKMISTKFWLWTGEVGNAPPARECTLMAKKSYFFLKGYAVCLGADIHAQDNAMVLTVLENLKDASVVKNGTVTGYQHHPVYIDGKEVFLTEEDQKFENVHNVTLHSQSLCLLNPHELKLRRNGNAPGYTEVVWEHGIDPREETYTYAVLPHANIQEAEEFCRYPQVQIIENSKKVQMILDKTTGYRYCVFWEAGECGGIKTDTPLLICITDQMLYMCDVTRHVKNAIVEINGKKYSFQLENTQAEKQSVTL